MIKRTRNALLLALTGALAAPAVAQDDLLPDIIIDESFLYDNEIRIEGGQRVLRLSNATANIGDGPLHLYGVFPDNGDGTQDVRQRVFRTDGSFWDRDAGQFTYHQNHGHIHFDNWASYRLREIVGDNGVGDIVAEGSKTSFCLIDLAIYDSTLPNFDPRGPYNSCGTSIQGLSVGWEDIYSKGLTGQSIPIEGVPDGEYWLESVVDPDDHVLEIDETNNSARIRITISDGGSGGVPDVYEPNNTRQETAGRTEGSPNSPNLGPCDPTLVIENLSVHVSGDDDWYRFYIPARGTSSDRVRIEFDDTLGDLDMELFNSAGSRVGSSTGSSDSETISLNGMAAGHYSLRVYGWSGATNPNYRLIIDPSANQAPSLALTKPPAGDTEVHQGEELYRMEWDISDPENNETWVTVWANTSPSFDGNEILMPTSVNTPGDQGFYVINTAYLDLGTYWILGRATDGGTTVEAVSPGTLTLVEFCDADFNRDGTADTVDVLDFLNAWNADDPDADVNGDGTVDVLDVLAFLNIWNAGC